MGQTRQLSAKSRKILEEIAAGYSYSQIVDSDHGFRYPGIFAAAAEALEICDSLDRESPTDYEQRMAEIKVAHPRAYEKWTEGDDAELKQRFLNGENVRSLSERFQRQPSAIRSRLRKLGVQD